MKSLYFLNPKFQASIHLRWLYSSVCVGPGRTRSETRTLVFSWQGSYHSCNSVSGTGNEEVMNQVAMPILADSVCQTHWQDFLPNTEVCAGYESGGKDFCSVRFEMSLVMRKPAFCICENKDADQLHGNREADQRLCFRFTDSTIPLLPTSEISSL